jgi:hypothetical protein
MKGPFLASAVAVVASMIYIVVVAPVPIKPTLAPDSLLESILREHGDAIGADFRAYRNHCLRVYNLAVTISQRRAPLEGPAATARNEILQIATAFHDIGLWTDNTVAYLSPSEKRATAWLSANGRSADIAIVVALIEEHHKVTPFPGPPLVSDFLQADWNDVLLGLATFGPVTRGEIKGLQAVFPNEGFHLRLAAFGFDQLRKDPLNPLPMFKW